MSLNSVQFTQPPLPGMGHGSLPVVQSHGKPQADADADALASYGGAGGAYSMGDNEARNPLRWWASGSSTEDAAVKYTRGGGREYPLRDDFDMEFVPTERVFSDQWEVNPDAVKHHVENVNPWSLDEPPALSARGDAYRVEDGNHRVNAAQARGQLFIEAAVYRQSGESPLGKSA